jgi:hypothetical protein
MRAGKSLPDEFRDLETFCAKWALTTEQERYFKLLDRSLDELRAFFDAVLPRSEAIISYLSRFPLDEMPADARFLHDLMVTFIETAQPIELEWKKTYIEEELAPERLRFNGPSAAAPPNRIPSAS